MLCEYLDAARDPSAERASRASVATVSDELDHVAEQRHAELNAALAKVRDPDVIFDAVDANHDGAISIDELQRAIQTITGREAPRERVAALVRQYDSDSDQQLSRDEFRSLCNVLLAPQQQAVSGEPAQTSAPANDGADAMRGSNDPTALFAAIDVDSNNSLSVDELVVAIGAISGATPARSRVAALLSKFDADSDGQLQLSEFRALCDYLGTAAQPGAQIARLERNPSGVFHRADTDADGTLTVDELRLAIAAVSGEMPSRAKVAGLIAQFDTDLE
jgi:Ca2+-binding EF-hand superfamily protein